MLQVIASLYPSEVVFSTSFGIEDQIITEWIGKNNIGIEIFTLDTGRLFKETYSLWSRTLERYQLNIKTYTPNTILLEDFISKRGLILSMDLLKTVKNVVGSERLNHCSVLSKEKNLDYRHSV
ncbi:phosphoadenosine phosphosulfate reductase family protein [Sphingobacterium sp. E70]|uniref:phosphoadenosine phosphosulfate reductase domain-containing protein n=1 Tax=Sphingobacterium sp. E70 TaxID=2853439 RepID=UPI00211BAFC8|nr:phosphoadenosine phosphosulfate reductase family protein [Sphingobacterium sp. E70]